MMNQPMKERTCHNRKSPPTTTAAVKSPTATVRTTCEGVMLTRTTPCSSSVGVPSFLSSVCEGVCLPLPSLGTGTLSFSGPVGGVFSSPVSSLPSFMPLPQLPLLAYDLCYELGLFRQCSHPQVALPRDLYCVA